MTAAATYCNLFTTSCSYFTVGSFGIDCNFVEQTAIIKLELAYYCRLAVQADNFHTVGFRCILNTATATIDCCCSYSATNRILNSSHRSCNSRCFMQLQVWLHLSHSQSSSFRHQLASIPELVPSSWCRRNHLSRIPR